MRSKISGQHFSLPMIWATSCRACAVVKAGDFFVKFYTSCHNASRGPHAAIAAAFPAAGGSAKSFHPGRGRLTAYVADAVITGPVVEEASPADSSDMLSRLIAHAQLGPVGYLNEEKVAIRALRAQEEEDSRQRLTRMWTEERKRQLQLEAQKRTQQIQMVGAALLVIVVLIALVLSLARASQLSRESINRARNPD